MDIHLPAATSSSPRIRIRSSYCNHVIAEIAQYDSSEEETDVITTQHLSLGKETTVYPGPSEPRLESEEETEADSTAHEAKEQGFVPEEEFIDSGHSEPGCESTKGEGEDETDAGTHQVSVPKKEDFVLEEEIIDAIKCGEESTIKEWLEKKETKVNECKGGEHAHEHFRVANGTALHWAAYYGQSGIAKLLIDNGAEPHMTDKAGETALHWACKSKQAKDDMVKILLDRMPEHQVNSTNSKGYTALHYACSEGQHNMALFLMEAKADPSAKSSAGYTPLDFAFLVGDKHGMGTVEMLDSEQLLLPSRYTESTLEEDIIEAIEKGDKDAIEKWLKREGPNLNCLRGRPSWWLYSICMDGYGTPLHWAAFYGQLDIAKLLIDSGANPRTKASDNGTVLHWACASDTENRELVKLLLQKIVEELIRHDRACVEHRIIEPKKALQEIESEGRTPLWFASFEGHHNIVKLLMKEGAKVESRDLQAAIEQGNEQVVSNLLQSPQWPTLLRQHWRSTTPFRELIKKMPGIAKQVLDRCVVSDPRTQDPKNKHFKVVFDYSFVEDHRDKHKSYPTKVPTVYPEDKRMAHGKRFDEVLQQEEKNFTTSYGPPFKKSNHPLAIMVQYERLDLLNHPVIRSLLHHKWFKFGLWGYLLNLFIYIIFLVILTSFALVVLHPQSTTCMQVLSDPLITACEQMEEVSSTGEFRAESAPGMMANDTAGMVANDTAGGGNETCIRCELSDGRSRFVFTAAVIIIVVGGIRLLLEASQLVYQLKSYLFDWVNWIEVSLYILSIIFVSVFRTTCLCPHVWQWQLGVMVIFLAWIDLIIVCAKFPYIGIHVIMFGKILGTFLKVLLLAVLLVATFGITFYMTFSEPQYQRSPFAPPATAMIKIMSMTAGDFSFDTIFRRSPSGESEDAQEILFPPMSYILWIIFVILMPILFTNMLVGLAVGDIQQIQEEANLRKLALQVELVLTTEDLLRLIHSHKRFITGKKTIKPIVKAATENKLEIHFLEWIYLAFKEISHQLWGGQRYDTLEIIQQILNSNLDSDSKDAVQEVHEDEDEGGKHIEAPEMMEWMMSQIDHQFKMMSERMQTLEKLIKETKAPNHGLDDPKK